MYVQDFLRKHDVWFESLLHRPVSCATKLASSVHVPGRGVAKTVLVRAGDDFVLTVLPATDRINLGRLAGVLGISLTQVRLASPDEILEVFELSPTRYYQLLNELIDSPEALKFDPVLVKRLRAQRARRQRIRSPKAG